jgi:hypothetical protein
MLNQPFFRVSLPIMITILDTVWALIPGNNRRLDDISARLGRIEDRLLGLESGFDAINRRFDDMRDPWRAELAWKKSSAHN